MTRPVDTLAEIESRQHTIRRYREMQALAAEPAPEPRDGFRLVLLASVLIWLAGAAVWVAWPDADVAQVTPREMARGAP